MIAALLILLPAFIIVVGLLAKLFDARRQEAALAAQARERARWEFDNWHHRTYGWIPERQPAASSGGGWWFIAWW